MVNFNSVAYKQEAVILHLPGNVSETKPTEKQTVHNKSTFVDPIPPEYIPKIKEFFLTHDNMFGTKVKNARDYTMFVLGCNLGRRIGDMVEFKFGDFINEDGSYKKYLNLLENKTEKYARLRINETVQEALTLYTKTLGEYNLSDLLFKSRKSNPDGTQRAIDTRSAWRLMKEAGDAVGLDAAGVNVGCHSMRKTLGRTVLDAEPNNPRQLANIQKLFNHSSPAVTLRYVGLEQKQMDDILEKVNI